MNYLVFDIIQLIANYCDVVTKFNIKSLCIYFYEDIYINSFYDILKFQPTKSKVEEYPKISSYIVNNINKHKYITELNITNYHNFYDSDIQHFKFLRVLYANNNITTNGIKYMNLDTLLIHTKVNPIHIKYMNLKVFYDRSIYIKNYDISHLNFNETGLWCNSLKYMIIKRLFFPVCCKNFNIKYLNLNTLCILGNDHVIGTDIEHMNLRYLYPNKNIKDNHIKYMNLCEIYASNDCSECHISDNCCGCHISNNSIKYMNINKLSADNNYEIDGHGIKYMNLTSLDIYYDDEITENYYKYMKLKKLINF